MTLPDQKRQNCFECLQNNKIKMGCICWHVVQHQQHTLQLWYLKPIVFFFFLRPCCLCCKKLMSLWENGLYILWRADSTFDQSRVQVWFFKYGCIIIFPLYLPLFSFVGCACWLYVCRDWFMVKNVCIIWLHVLCIYIFLHMFFSSGNKIKQNLKISMWLVVNGLQQA